MSAASALSGWLEWSTSWGAGERSVIGQAVVAPNATTSSASTAPMMRSRPGSVVAAERSRSTPSAQAVRLAGAGAGAADPAPGGCCCGGMLGLGGAALPFGGYVTRPSPMESYVGRKYRCRAGHPHSPCLDL